MVQKALIATLLSAGLLAGCTAGSVPQLGTDNPRFFIPGSEARVEIFQDVVLEPRKLRGYFQDGRQLAHEAVNPYYPNCHVEFNQISEQTRTVPPGSYAVVRTERRYAPLARFEPVQVASLEMPQLAMRLGGSPTINFETRFFLKRIEGGAEDIRSLNCAQWGDPETFDSYPTPEEIATALGKAGELKL